MPAAAEESTNVKVVVRCRPINGKEISAGRQQIVQMDTTKGIVSIRNPADAKAAPKDFGFDAVFDWK